MTDENTQRLLSFAENVAARYGALPEVEAVAVAGSLTTGAADPGSDIDLYVYTHAEIPINARHDIAATGAEHAEVNNQIWEPGDEWVDAATGIHMDVMFRSMGWIEEQLDRVLRRHQASVGYSTSFWHNVLTSKALYDRGDQFRTIQQTADQPYPEPLRQAIVAKNHPILRDTLSSYMYQLGRAVGRNDLVSINHRVAALLASYFDIIFAVNHIPHPGEKRMMNIASVRCEKLPANMRQQVNALFHAAAQGGQEVLAAANALIDELDHLLRTEGFDIGERGNDAG